MSRAPQPTATARPTTAHAGPLQVVLAAIAVCVLYWSVGINDTSVTTSPSSAPSVHLQQIGSATTVGSAVAVELSASGQVR
ncbi:MAG: hypothetical protein WB473_07525 [Pedococcus sp.]